MASVISYESDQNAVRLLVSSMRGGNLVIDQMIEIPLTEDSELQSDLSPLESALQQAVRHATIGGQPDTIAVLRRSQSEMRLLTLPQMPPEELPDTIRLQAPQLFNTPDGGPIDFTELGDSQESQQYISAATIAPDVLSATIAAASLAGLTASSVVLRSFSSAFLLQQQKASDKHRLIIDLLESEAELTVSYHGMPHFARTIRLPESGMSDNHMLAEVNRTIASYANQPTPGEIELITLIGDTPRHRSLQSELNENLDLEVELYDPLNDVVLSSRAEQNVPNSPFRFAALIGTSLQHLTDQRAVLDFVNPRQPPQPVSQARKSLKYVLSGIVACLLLGSLLAWPIITRNNEIDSLNLKLVNRDQHQKRFQLLNAQLQSINSFEEGRVNWLDELVVLSGKCLTAKQARIDRFTARTASSMRKTDMLGQIYLDVHLNNSDTLGQLESNLLSSGHLVTGTGIQPDNDNEDYPWTVTERIVIVKTTEPADTSPDSATPSDKDSTPDTDAASSEDKDRLKTTQTSQPTLAEEL